MKSSTILTKALKLLQSKPKGKAWTKGTDARGATGRPVKPCGKAAVCWCAAGAVIVFSDSALFNGIDWEVFKFLEKAALDNVVDFNDAPTTKFADVVKMFKKAIRLAKKEGN